MKKVLAAIGSCSVMVFGASNVFAQEADECPAPPVVTPAQPQVVPQARAYSQGQWVWTDEYGWVWVPAASAPLEVQGEPYVYLYTPTYGWTWFVSPWGWYGPSGAYHVAPHAVVPPRIAAPRPFVVPRTFAAPRVVAHPAVGGVHGGRR